MHEYYVNVQEHLIYIYTRILLIIYISHRNTGSAEEVLDCGRIPPETILAALHGNSLT